MSDEFLNEVLSDPSPCFEPSIDQVPTVDNATEPTIFDLFYQDPSSLMKKQSNILTGDLVNNSSQATKSSIFSSAASTLSDSYPDSSVLFQVNSSVSSHTNSSAADIVSTNPIKGTSTNDMHGLSSVCGPICSTNGSHGSPPQSPSRSDGSSTSWQTDEGIGSQCDSSDQENIDGMYN